MREARSSLGAKERSDCRLSAPPELFSSFQFSAPQTRRTERKKRGDDFGAGTQGGARSSLALGYHHVVPTGLKWVEDGGWRVEERGWRDLIGNLRLAIGKKPEMARLPFCHSVKLQAHRRCDTYLRLRRR